MFVNKHMIAALFIIALPIACVTRTVIFEEVLREARDYCANKSKTCNRLLKRKFFYLFTCEYCFSHYVTIVFLFITRYHLLFDDWRGYMMAFFSLVIVANTYLNLYSRLRVDITAQKVQTKVHEKQIEAIGMDGKDGHPRISERTLG